MWGSARQSLETQLTSGWQAVLLSYCPSVLVLRPSETVHPRPCGKVLTDRSRASDVKQVGYKCEPGIDSDTMDRSVIQTVLQVNVPMSQWRSQHNASGQRLPLGSVSPLPHCMITAHIIATQYTELHCTALWFSAVYDS